MNTDEHVLQVKEILEHASKLTNNKSSIFIIGA